MSKLHDLLKCPICKETLAGIPVILSCCHETVCAHHTEKHNETIQGENVFTCVLCETSHDMSDRKKFAPNKIAEKLIKIESDKSEHSSDIYLQTQNEINNLEVSLKQINDFIIKSSTNFTCENILALKREVNLRKEKTKWKIDAICDEMIQKLDKYLHECYANVNSTTQVNSLKEMEKYIFKWTKDKDEGKSIQDGIREHESKVFNNLIISSF